MNRFFAEIFHEPLAEGTVGEIVEILRQRAAFEQAQKGQLKLELLP